MKRKPLGVSSSFLYRNALRMNKGNWAAHLALIAVAAIFGGNYIVARDVMVDGFISPNAFILIRVLSATVLFFLLHRSHVKFSTKEHIRLILCGLTGVAVNQLFFFNGLKLSGPIQSSLIMITTPVLVYLISLAFMGVKFSLIKSFGIVLGLSGAALIIYDSRSTGQFENALLGNTMVFINALSYAIYLVLVKPLMTKYNPVIVLKYVFLYGLIFVLPFGFIPFTRIDTGAFTQTTWLQILYVILLTTYMAYRLNGFALSKVSPTIVSIYLYLQPVIASILSILLGIELLDWNKSVAAMLIVTGIAFVSLKRPFKPVN